MRLRTIGDVVGNYITNYRRGAADELKGFADEKHFGAVLARAGMAVDRNGYRFVHQYRRSASQLRRWTLALRARKRKLRVAATFDDLHETLSSASRSIRGIGPLTVYDTALRIGASLELKPDRVYLHSGTRKGARLFGFGKRRWIKRSELPAEFSRLTDAEAEDCLCLYRLDLAAILRKTMRDGHSRATKGCAPRTRHHSIC